MYGKPYSELTFTDDFMFCKVLTTNLDLCQELLELVLGIKIRRLAPPESQKTINTTYDGRGIRLDVYVEDDSNTVFNIEMQTTIRRGLPRRLRYYQSMIDLDLLERGADFRQLKKSYVIFLCLDDPFGHNLPVYQFENLCVQKPDVPLGDDTVKVVVNAAGSRDGISDELAGFLNYLSSNTAESGLPKRLQEAVGKAITHEEWEAEYMTMRMKIQEEREEAMQQGMQLGKLDLLRNLMTNLKMTCAQAMDAAGIPAAERELYASQIDQ